MPKNPPLTAAAYARIDHLVRQGKIAVARAQEESRQMGVPNVYCFNGRIYYELPTGELSLTDPWPEQKCGRQSPSEDQRG